MCELLEEEAFLTSVPMASETLCFPNFSLTQPLERCLVQFENGFLLN